MTGPAQYRIRWARWLIGGVALDLVALALGLLFAPRPAPVNSAVVSRGPIGGAPLIEVSDQTGLEAAVDFLSQDAVRIREGMPAEHRRHGDLGLPIQAAG